MVQLTLAICIAKVKTVIGMQSDVEPEWSSVLTGPLDAKGI